MATEVESGDLVQAAGHAGPWTVVEVRQGMALLEHSDGHRLSRRTTTLTVVRKGSGKKATAVEDGNDENGAPTLFD
ncbi:hypothetical protein ACH49M_05210 [Rhodococcus qingshengii]|uniref:hypothetical protein n=1 Tax=Rhodococcus TaxID=1827 RepID=UPI0009C35C29|nr:MULTISPECIES: hypothetical protein [Rhodococcus]ARE35922.1 hypothetical protein A0W34_23485 [Rhodococcus sp. BH4]MCX6476492.1 hypothetical protein [Rhodococcus sp. (in: high G+C Gram-positive bacteria)]ORC27988.1 hypothetical protein BXO91_06900 [Rhodococcus qingshengii]QXC42020.1 hypothetical protein KSE96_23535 [Rhodococcus qingshengii]WNF40737.1 hypothetical protein RHP72_23605 [Rhodococcus sp. SG20037]